MLSTLDIPDTGHEAVVGAAGAGVGVSAEEWREHRKNAEKSSDFAGVKGR